MDAAEPAGDTPAPKRSWHATHVGGRYVLSMAECIDRPDHVLEAVERKRLKKLYEALFEDRSSG